MDEYKIGQFVEKLNVTIVKFCKANNCHALKVENGYIITEGERKESQREVIRIKREQAYAKESDPLKYDYDKAVARGDSNVIELRDLWLNKCDEIKKRLPYDE